MITWGDDMKNHLWKKRSGYNGKDRLTAQARFYHRYVNEPKFRKICRYYHVLPLDEAIKFVNTNKKYLRYKHRDEVVAKLNLQSFLLADPHAVVEFYRNVFVLTPKQIDQRIRWFKPFT